MSFPAAAKDILGSYVNPALLLAEKTQVIAVAWGEESKEARAHLEVYC